ncbi:MAG: hypothetical protein ACOZE5_18335 [Verrucomicrobiota bacterium]
MAKKNINKLNRKNTGASLSAGLLNVQRMLSQPGRTLLLQLVTAAADATGGAHAKDADWSWAVSCTSYVIRRGAWVQEQERLGRKISDKDSRIGSLHSLLCLRCREEMAGDVRKARPVNPYFAKIGEAKTLVPAAARLEAKKSEVTTPRKRGEKHLQWARDSFVEDGNLAKPVELIDQAAEELKAAS